jgi:cell division protein FtsQ
MLKSRKPRKNYRKGKKAARHFAFLGRFMICFKITGGIVLLVAVSCVFIFAHDFLTQCDYLRAQRLIIEGNRRISESQIAAQAQLTEGMNILSANLSLVRKKLLAHPWIAEVEVSREIPPALKIIIKEHVPLAVVDLGRKFLINENGEIFKEWSPVDPVNLPLVSGLEISDLPAYGQAALLDPGSESGLNSPSEPEPSHYTPLQAVMQVLRLGRESESILPNRLIRKIWVDREIGITLQAFSQIGTVNLGYNNYLRKYDMLKSIVSYLNQRNGFPAVDRIDLNNLDRIVVSPRRIDTPPGDDKEV